MTYEGSQRDLRAATRRFIVGGHRLFADALLSARRRVPAARGELPTLIFPVRSGALRAPPGAWAIGLSFALMAALAGGCKVSPAYSSDASSQADAQASPDASDVAPSDASADASPDASAVASSDAGTGGSDASLDGSQDAANPDGSSDAGAAKTVGWVLTYFGNAQDLPSDSLHLAYSLDGLNWTELNGGLPAFQLSGIGTNHIRDPFILRKLDGTFVYLATDWTLAQNDANYWNSPSGKLVVVDSADLITFTNPRLVSVTTLPGPNSSPMHAWAPEAFYDSDKGQYGIVWSGNDAAGTNHAYVTYTSDFQTFSDPANPTVYFDPGYTVIDASPLRSVEHNYLFFKDESAQDIQVARSATTSMAPGAFTRLSAEYITRGTNQSVSQGTEGPFALKAPNQDVWYLYADRYGEGGVFGGWKTLDLDAAPSSWTEMSSTEYHFPPNVRHANVVRVTQAQLDAVVAHYGASPLYKVRTSYSENGVPFYVAHSWFHLMITFLSDTSHGQLPNDFHWRVVPGLADPTDSTLVSFVPAAFPGTYVRINSQNPALYPTCTSSSPPNAANRGTELCAVPSTEQNHLAWADPYADSDTFRSDATFRKVSARNGDSTMVSFQWYGDSTRYLRHMDYQIFATPLSTAADNAAASFALEKD